MEKEKSFWKTEEGKIIGHGIHDFNGALELLKTYTKKYSNEFPNGLFKTKEEFDEKIIETLKRAQTAVDYIYTEFKKKHEESLKEEI